MLHLPPSAPTTVFQIFRQRILCSFDLPQVAIGRNNHPGISTRVSLAGPLKQRYRLLVSAARKSTSRGNPDFRGSIASLDGMDGGVGRGRAVERRPFVRVGSAPGRAGMRVSGAPNGLWRRSGLDGPDQPGQGTPHQSTQHGAEHHCLPRGQQAIIAKHGQPPSLSSGAEERGSLIVCHNSLHGNPN